MRHYTTYCLAVMGLVWASDLGTSVAQADLQEANYHIQEIAFDGAALQADLFFDFSVGPAIVVLDSSTPVGAGLRVGTFLLFTWQTPENGTDLFLGFGDAPGEEYFGFYLSLDGTEGWGSFTLELVE